MSDTSLIGLTLAGRFRITGVIGEGGMATVYRGTVGDDPDEVAIKIMNPELAKESRFVRRFRREAKAAAMLKHPNTVQILEFGVDHGYVFLAMELLKGFDLAMLLHRERKIPELRAVHIVIQVCRALSAAHEESIIHRDLKPDNIMLVRQPPGQPPPVAGLGPTDFVKVLDFGIAKILDEDGEKPIGDPRAEPITQEKSMLTRVGTIVGTPAYMAPEQGRAEAVDPRTDLYACGVLLYELITGRVPFTGETPMQVVMRHVNEIPRPPSDHGRVHPDLERLIMRALAKYPSERQQSAEEMAFELLSVMPVLGGASAAQDEGGGVKKTLVLDRAPSSPLGPSFAQSSPRPAAGAPPARAPATGRGEAGAPAQMSSMSFGGAAAQALQGRQQENSGGPSPFPTLNIEVPDDIFPQGFGSGPATNPQSSDPAATRRIADTPAPRPAAGQPARTPAPAAGRPARAEPQVPLVRAGQERASLDQTMQSLVSDVPPPPSDDDEEAATIIKPPNEHDRSRMSLAEEAMAKALGQGPAALPKIGGPESIEPTLVAGGKAPAARAAPGSNPPPAHAHDKTSISGSSPPPAGGSPQYAGAMATDAFKGGGNEAPTALVAVDLKNLAATMPLEPEQVDQVLQDALAGRRLPPAPALPGAVHGQASTVMMDESAPRGQSPAPLAAPAAAGSAPQRAQDGPQRRPTAELVPLGIPEEAAQTAEAASEGARPSRSGDAPLVWQPSGRRVSGATALVLGIAIGALVVGIFLGLVLLLRPSG